MSDLVGRRQSLLTLGPFVAPAGARPPVSPRTVRLCSEPPGGAADRLARMLGDRLEAHWKQPVVLENKPGGGVVIGTQAVVRAPAGRPHHRPPGQFPHASTPYSARTCPTR